ncbi:MAG: acetate kinase [Bacteroidota bacterium]
MKILVLNCGSSSIKYQLLDMKGEEVLALGIVERVGSTNAEITHKVPGKEKYCVEKPVPDHQIGIDLILEILLSDKYGVLKDKSEITAVGHRVVHGGETFSGSVRITQEVIDKMEECVELAPLHNPANLKGIYAMKKLLPDVPQCGTFDTAFHQTMPEHTYMYALPYELYEKYKIRRYGFHGASHRFVSETAAEFIGKPYDQINIITCHLGNGASMTAIKKGKSFDTSMGLTPVEGLIMGTRCGDLDLGALLFIMNKEKLDVNGANNLVNKTSGVFGISGISHDMRDIENAAWKENNHRAKLALEMYCYRVKKYIGSYAVAMGGVDIIVFTGGVGENGPETRDAICSDLEFMGVKLNKEKNNGLRGKLTDISQPDSKVKVLVVPTNEELVIARDALEIINKE